MKELSFKRFLDNGGASLLNEAKKSIRADAELYSFLQNQLGLNDQQIDDNLAVLLDFQEDRNYCKNCPGFDKCSKNQPHYKMKLEFDGKMVVREFAACDELQKRQDYASRFIRHDFPMEWNEKSFEDIDESIKIKPIILEMRKVVSGESSRWLFLTGKFASGKSYLLACLANEFAKKNPPVAFCDTYALIERLKNLAFSNSKEQRDKIEKAIELYSSCPLLILDNFGNEFKSEYVFSTILYPILSARREANLVTCFASDFKLEDILREYSRKVGALRIKQFMQMIQQMIKKELNLEPLDGVYSD